jgi:4-hydroxy-tetrahydrodipicolinate reductase
MIIMKVGLIGYGKMGKEIEKIAIGRGHDIQLIIDVKNLSELVPANIRQCDVAIEFTMPESAVKNYLTCFEAGVPVVSGTTGWLHQRGLVHDMCKKYNGTFFYASNFSIGVNLFFEINRKLAELMANHHQYKPRLKEIHHTQKLDAPSGTAITLAEELLNFMPGLTGWTMNEQTSYNLLPITAERTGEVPGTHIITYESYEDYIEITHLAKNRKGFAIGAVMAAEFCQTHEGILNMSDLLKL